MRSAQEYLDAAVAAKPSPYDYGDFEESQALAAVQAALDDAEKYKSLLLRSIRNSSPQAKAPALCNCSMTTGT